MRDLGRRMSMDSRMVDKIRRSPQMLAEQGGSEFLSEWGGPTGYSFWAKQPVAHRVTYFAVQEGLTTVKDIAGATGLKEKEVNDSLTALEGKGIVPKGLVTA